LLRRLARGATSAKTTTARAATKRPGCSSCGRRPAHPARAAAFD